jgi:hypothetical protein
MEGAMEGLVREAGSPIRGDARPDARDTPPAAAPPDALDIHLGRTFIQKNLTLSVAGPGSTMPLVRIDVLQGHSDADYVGGELSAMALGFGPRIGVFQRVGAGDGSSTRVTFDFGFGL